MAPEEIATALNKPGFSWAAAHFFALASKLSYSSADTVRSVCVGDWGFDDAKFINIHHSQAFVAYNETDVVVCFRGTESLGDWLVDLKITNTKRPYGHIHKGFFEAYQLVEPTIAKYFQTAAASGKRLWLTGHSLGAALATVAALEMPQTAALAGIYTFGQPRCVDWKSGTFGKEKFGQLFCRFVNDDDLVTRVPPHFWHFGNLVHFDSRGDVQRVSADLETVGVEEPALTVPEFEAVKQQIRAVRESVKASSIGNETLGTEISNEGVFNVSIAGLIPGVADHSMDRYLSVISRRATPDKEDPLDAPSRESVFSSDEFLHSGNESPPGSTGRIRTMEKADFENIESLPGQQPSDEQRKAHILRLRSPAWSPPDGIRANSIFGSIATVNATEAELEQLRTDPDVISIEVSRQAGMEELDRSVSHVGGRTVQRPPVSETGDSAIVGIIDTGIDILHQAFLGKDGNTRIVAIWNQRDQAGPTPKAMDAAHFSQDHGTLILANEINALIEDFHSNNIDPQTALRDPQGHGSHVASIAAGQNTGALAAGLAPDAKIIAVIPNMTSTPADPYSLGYSVSHVDALAFLQIAARGRNAIIADPLPISINVSLGMNAGAHDGTSTLEAAFDAITGRGRDPGCVVVKSAGNERSHGGHARITAFQGVVEVTWHSETLDREEDYIEVWFDALDDLEFVLIDPSGNRSSKVSFASPVATDTLGGNKYWLSVTKGHRDNGDNRLIITIRPSQQRIQPGTWRLETVGQRIRSQRGQVDLWVERVNSRPLRFKVEAEEGTLSIPGTAESVITVGACDLSEPPRLTSSSSYGLTRDQRAKPEICAPGQAIRAARSGQDDLSASVALTGTSMAAPHVTGAIALALSLRHKQADQTQFNANQIRAALLRSARNFSGLHHPGFGYGSLDVEQFLRELNLI